MNESLDVNDEIQVSVEKYADMIMRIAYHNLKNKADAEDITQEAFLKLMEHGLSFESEAHKKAWLIRVTINMCKNLLNTAWFRRTGPLEESAYSFNEEEQETLGAVLELPRKYRNVIYLYYYEGYSVSEISQILQQKENTVSSWLHRARNQLKTELTEEVVTR